MAKAGGLADGQAEPAGVYVYRREPRELAERLGVDCSKFVGPLVPVVYNADFRDPAAFFLASQFEMQDKDVLFAANAATVDTAKFLQFVCLVIGTANDTIIIDGPCGLRRLFPRPRERSLTREHAGGLGGVDSRD